MQCVAQTSHNSSKLNPKKIMNLVLFNQQIISHVKKFRPTNTRIKGLHQILPFHRFSSLIPLQVDPQTDSQTSPNPCTSNSKIYVYAFLDTKRIMFKQTNTISFNVLSQILNHQTTSLHTCTCPSQANYNQQFPIRKMTINIFYNVFSWPHQEMAYLKLWFSVSSTLSNRDFMSSKQILNIKDISQDTGCCSIISCSSTFNNQRLFIITPAVYRQLQ